MILMFAALYSAVRSCSGRCSLRHYCPDGEAALKWSREDYEQHELDKTNSFIFTVECCSLILVVTEKNDAAQQIARLLSESGASRHIQTLLFIVLNVAEKTICRYWSRGHILQPDFPLVLKFDKEEGWYGETAEGEHLPADVPDGLGASSYMPSASLYGRWR